MSTLNNGGADIQNHDEDNLDLRGDLVDTTLFSEIAPNCEDDSLLAEYEAWTDDIELWQAYPGIPVPGPNAAWVGLLTRVIPSGSYLVKFPRGLGEKLRPWIPARLYGSTVAAK